MLVSQLAHVRPRFSFGISFLRIRELYAPVSPVLFVLFGALSRVVPGKRPFLSFVCFVAWHTALVSECGVRSVR